VFCVSSAHPLAGAFQLKGKEEVTVGFFLRWFWQVVEGAANAVVQASANAEGRLTVLALDGVYKLLVLMLQSTDEALKESVWQHKREGTLY
jgi:hypothetical protein